MLNRQFIRIGKHKFEYLIIIFHGKSKIFQILIAISIKFCFMLFDSVVCSGKPHNDNINFSNFILKW